MSFLRFLMLLTLVLWVGGILFLAFVEAPIAFTPRVLPTRHVAGFVVGRSVDRLHYIGIASGVVFLIVSMIYCRLTAGNARPLALRHIAIVAMICLTLISQFAVTPKMWAVRSQAGVIDNLAQNDPLRLEFGRLHEWSENLEKAILLLGLVALFRTSQELK